MTRTYSNIFDQRLGRCPLDYTVTVASMSGKCLEDVWKASFVDSRPMFHLHWLYQMILDSLDSNARRLRF